MLNIKWNIKSWINIIKSKSLKPLRNSNVNIHDAKKKKKSLTKYTIKHSPQPEITRQVTTYDNITKNSEQQK